MSQTTILSSINRTTDYPITVSSTADSHCGTLQLILGSGWSEQMLCELPAINITILTENDSRYLSFDINMTTVNEDYQNKTGGPEPVEPYSLAVYDLPGSFKFSVTPLFDEYALDSHNENVSIGNIPYFQTSDKGIVDTDIDNYSSEIWDTPTTTFPITINFDDSNVSSGGSGGGGGGTPTAADVTYDGSTPGLVATNVQDAIDEVQGNVNVIESTIGDINTILEEVL